MTSTKQIKQFVITLVTRNFPVPTVAMFYALKFLNRTCLQHTENNSSDDKQLSNGSSNQMPSKCKAISYQ